MLSFQDVAYKALDTANKLDFFSVFVHGPPGSGKRFTLQKYFQDINYQVFFHDLNTGFDPFDMLIAGDETEAGSVSFSRKAPGLARYSSDIVLILFNAQHATQNIKQLLLNVLRTRKIQDKNSNFWKIQNNVKLALVLDIIPDAETSVFDPIFSSVDVQINLDIDYDDMEGIIRNFFEKHNLSCNFTQDFVSAFKILCIGLTNNLHDIETIFQFIKTDLSPGTVLTEQHLFEATSRAITPILSSLSYRGRPISSTHFHQWQSQFTGEAKFVPGLIVRKLYEKYYISSRMYYMLIRNLIIELDIPRQSSIVFCKWQKIGKSSPKISNDLKTLAQWNIDGEIDLETSSENWPNVKQHSSFIIADDFVGSGDTLMSLLSNKSHFLELFQKYNIMDVRIIVLVGFKSALQIFHDRVRTLGFADKIKIHYGKMFDDHDRCFSDVSTIFNDETKRILFDFCTSFARTYFKKPRPFFVQGHKDIGSLVVFEHTVPNNSLPILWVDNTPWYSLFPASGHIS